MLFLLVVFTGYLFVTDAAELQEPKFQVLTPDELMVEVPKYDNVNLITFRIGVKRKDHQNEDLELGENDIDNSRIFIYDQRLNLKKGDTVNYILALRGEDGYRALTGKYVFDGVYYKKPSSRRRHRFRRHILSTTEKADYNTEEDTEEFDPAEPRFGGRFPHHNPRRHWPNHGPPPFNPFGRGHPPFQPFPPNQPPPFGPGGGFGSGDCNDHRHDLCHNRNNPGDGRWQSSTVSPKDGSRDVEFHCKICKKYSTDATTVKTTTEDTPDIDIRFADQN